MRPGRKIKTPARGFTTRFTHPKATAYEALAVVRKSKKENKRRVGNEKRGKKGKKRTKSSPG